MYPVKTNNLKVTSYYGNRQYTYQGKLVKDFHNGIDLVGGFEIVAFADGVVTAISNVGEQYGRACYVRLKHNNGWQTLYYHLKSGSVCVSVGQSVTKGQKLGIMGATGVATGVHLHFQIDKGTSSTSINPYDYIFNSKELVPSTPSDISKKSVDELAKEVIAGVYGNGADRRNALGSRFDEVQARVNEILKGNSSSSNTTPTPQPQPSGHTQAEKLEIVKRTIRGDFGNQPNRQKKIESLGYDYKEIQNQVNKNLSAGRTRWDNIIWF